MRQPARLISHWYVLVEGLRASPLEFYQSLENAISQREAPGINLTRVDWNEGGVLSAKREYLRVSRGRLAFDVCGAPFGKGFFFSWWLTETRTPFAGLLAVLMLAALVAIFAVCTSIAGWILGSVLTIIFIGVGVRATAASVRTGGAIVLEDALLATPVLGWVYIRWFRTETFYRIDTTLMFQELVHKCVLEVSGGMLNQQGLRGLSDQEQQPRIRDLAMR